MKKVSIVIPCYNSSDYIHRCVNSLLTQTIGIENLQLIFVDDASTDNTVDILYEYEKQYPNDILIVICEQNGRQGTARNIGMNHATADYIGFIDHDDRADKTMFQKLYEKAIEYNCDMVACNWVGVFDENEEVINDKGESKLYEINTIEDRKKLIHNGIGKGGFWSRIYKKSFIFDNNISFPERLVYDDNYFVAIISLHIKRIYYVNESLYHYFLNHISAVRKPNAEFHFDRLKIEQMIIEYCRSKNLLDVYKDELEFAFVSRYYINSLGMFLTRFEEAPVDIINKMQDTLVQLFPMYINNPYIEEFNENEKAILSTADKKLSQKVWNEIANIYKDEIGWTN